MEQALKRRRELSADITLGQVELWIGVGANIGWPWIDVAVRVGKGWGAFVDHNGPMIQRPDFIAFVPALRAFVEGDREDVLLGSLGGSMRLVLRRSEHGTRFGELWFQHGPNTQTISFSVWDESLRAAVPAAEAALERVNAFRNLGWVPAPERLALLPHASEIEPPAPLQHFEAWDSGLQPDGEPAFSFEVDGYGWFGVAVRVGDKIGEFGGGWLSDVRGALLRAGLALLAGARSAELLCHTEPGTTRIEFETQQLRMDVTDENLPGATEIGCWIRIRNLNEGFSTGPELEFEALCPSPRAVAEAIHRMGLAMFEHGAGPWSDAMAALDGALANMPKRQD